MNERIRIQDIGVKLEALSRRWRNAALPIMQSALAAGLSWLVAVQVVDHRMPFFAPIAAVICLGITLGQRLRRGIELVAGVTIGIGIGDLLIYLFGTGPWQIAVVVALAMSAAILVDGGPVITIQSAVSAVLVATLYFPGQTSGVTRMVDVIGGVTGLAVAAALPGAPLRVAHRHTRRVLAELARALHGVADAIRDRDLDSVAAILARARDSQRMVDDLRTALETAGEIAMMAPSRWRERPRLDRYLALITPVDFALQNTRVLVRRAGAAIRAGEAMPAPLHDALDKLAEAVELLSTELAEGREPDASRRRMQNAARSAGEGLIGTGGISTSVVLAQLRSVVIDLLQATGMARSDALAFLPVLNPAAHAFDHSAPVASGARGDVGSDATGSFADAESQLRQSRAGTSQHALLPGRDSETRRQPGSSPTKSGDLTPSGAVSAAVKQFTAKLDRRPAQLSRRSTAPVEDKSVVSHTPPDGPRPG